MPTISSFNLNQNISSGVSSATIDKSGAGAVAKAVSQIGAKGAQIANQFLAEEKQQESKRYNLRKSTEKDSARSEEYDRAASSFDPSLNKVVFKSEGPNGSIKEENTGLDLHSYMDKWDSDWNGQNAVDAPTTQAKNLFETQDLSSRKMMLARASKDTLVQNKAWEIDGYTESKEESVKSMAKLGKSLGRIEGEETLLKVREAYFSADAVNTADQDRKILRNSERAVSNGYLKTQFQHDNLIKAGSILEVGTFDLENPTAQGNIVKEKLNGIVQSFYDNNKVNVVSQGMTESGDLKIITDNGKAMIVQADGSVAVSDKGTEEINLPMIDVSGEVLDRANPLKDALTDGEYLGWLGKFYDGLETKLKQKKSQMMTEYKGLSKRLKSDDPNIALNYNDPETREMVQGYTEQIVAAVGPEKATPLVADLAGSVVIKSMQEEPFIPAADMMDKAKNSSNNIDAVIADLGVEESIENKNLMAQVKGNIRNGVMGWAASNAQHQHKAEYVTSHDSRARELDAVKDESPKAHQEYIDRLNTRFDQTKTPKGKRQMYKPDYLSQEADRVNSFLAKKDEAGLNSAFEWGHEHRSIKGPTNFKNFIDSTVNTGKMDPAIRMSLLQPNSSTGVMAGKEMMDSVVNKEAINTNHSTAFVGEESKIRKEVYNRIKDHSNFLAVKTNFSGSQEEIKALNDVVLLQAKKIQLRDGSVGNGDAANKAFDVILKNNWTVVKEGDAATVFSPMFLQDAGVSPDQATGMVEVYSKPENLLDVVDLNSIVDPGFAKSLTKEELSDKSVVNKRLKDWFLDGAHKIDVIPNGPVLNFKLRQGNGVSKGVMLLGKDGEQLAIPLGEAANNQKVINANKGAFQNLQEGTVQFFDDMISPLR